MAHAPEEYPPATPLHSSHPHAPRRDRSVGAAHPAPRPAPCLRRAPLLAASQGLSGAGRSRCGAPRCAILAGLLPVGLPHPGHLSSSVPKREHQPARGLFKIQLSHRTQRTGSTPPRTAMRLGYGSSRLADPEGCPATTSLKHSRVTQHVSASDRRYCDYV